MLTNRGYEIRQMPGLVASNTFLTLAYETLSGTTNFIQATQESFGLSIAPIFVFAQTWFDLSLGAVGDGPISYQWFKDGVALAGETNSVLHVENIAPDHAGLYAVESRNEFGSSLPARAQILVESP
jgi:hypothetical protein